MPLHPAPRVHQLARSGLKGTAVPSANAVPALVQVGGGARHLYGPGADRLGRLRRCWHHPVGREHLDLEVPAGTIAAMWATKSLGGAEARVDSEAAGKPEVMRHWSFGARLRDRRRGERAAAAPPPPAAVRKLRLFIGVSLSRRPRFMSRSSGGGSPKSGAEAPSSSGIGMSSSASLERGRDRASACSTIQ